MPFLPALSFTFYPWIRSFSFVFFLVSELAPLNNRLKSTLGIGPSSCLRSLLPRRHPRSLPTRKQISQIYLYLFAICDIAFIVVPSLDTLFLIPTSFLSIPPNFSQAWLQRVNSTCLFFDPGLGPLILVAPRTVRDVSFSPHIGHSFFPS